MLTNERIFCKIIDLFSHINRNRDLPRGMPDCIWEKMEPEGLFKKSTILHKQGDIMKKAYFVVSGYILLYYYDEKGDKRSFRICPSDNIVLRNSFLERRASSYYIWVSKGAVLKSLSYDAYTEICNSVIGFKELMLKTANFYEPEELLRNDLICQSGRDCVFGFYAIFEDLLPKDSVITDVDVASYLNISTKTLRKFRKVVKEEGGISADLHFKNFESVTL